MSAVAERGRDAEDGRVAAGQRSHDAILANAVDLASAEGLEGLSIGRLAERTEMSKSGLFAHFGSKQELQLATVERAREIFTAEAVAPAAGAAPGLARLRALLDSWLAYFGREVFAGGCFFVAASTEFDDREGPVRDAVDAAMSEWVAFLEAICAEAVEMGELSGVEPGQLAFELNAIGMATNWELRLRRNPRAIEFARVAFDRALSAEGGGRG
jgi:AcrR family transcriptional regulator